MLLSITETSVTDRFTLVTHTAECVESSTTKITSVSNYYKIKKKENCIHFTSVNPFFREIGVLQSVFSDDRCD